MSFDAKIHTINGENVAEEIFGGTAYILFSHGSKAKRVSYSTSHSETLAAISGLEAATLLMPEKKPTLQQLAALQEKGIPYLPIDSYTDCRDFLVIDSWNHRTSSRSKSANLHPGLQRGENTRKSSMDHPDPNRIFDT